MLYLKPFKQASNATMPQTIPLLFRERVKEIPEVTLQVVKNEIGKFDHLSYELVYRRMLDLACVLRKMGVRRGDRIGLIADNRREWLVTDLAILALGACDVPRGCDSMGVEIRFILSFAECKIAFFENQRQLEKVLEKVEEVPLLKDAIVFDSPDDETIAKAAAVGISVHKFIELEDKGKQSSYGERGAVEVDMNETKSDEVATIIFTSGTTGTPKGVMLTHENYIAQCEVIKKVFPDARQGELWMSVLPVWHSFERAFQYFFMVLKSGCVYSKPVVSLMLSDMEATHPNWMCGVPRLWESIAQRFYRDLRKEGGLHYALFSISISIGKSFSWARDRVFGLICRYKKTIRIFDTLYAIIPFVLLYIPYKLCDFLVYRNIRSRLGGKMNGAISGGGSLQPSTDAFYHAIGFKLLEGYGLTETAPVLSMRYSKKPRSGCVGQVFPSVQVKIVDYAEGKPITGIPLPPGKKGLVMAKGRQIMKGYYKRPDLTEAVIDKDGWFNTGDIGVLTYDNELKITGRAKDTIVLLGGENIEPEVIENAICSSKYIETAVVLGQDQKYIAALCVPDKDAVSAYAEENRIIYENYDALLESSEIQSLIRDEIDTRICAKEGFRTCERVFKFVLLPNSFTVGEELNAKQVKLRAKIEKKYAHQIKKLFD
ncbi:MAG: long-chain fatty acid--CoA ligase [Treponema sp.]|nr:long-chain fatty acid--CoA ligase [Treponema sp.]